MDRRRATKIVLAIDGGGIRGIVPLVILRYIEDQLQRPACEIFDVLVGTSTGALIATLLTLPVPHTADNALRIYKRFGKEIFRSSWFRRNVWHWVHGTRYSSANLRHVVETLCGKTLLGDLQKTVAFPVYDIQNERRLTYETHHYDHRRLRVSDVLCSCVAAPTYFKPQTVKSVQDGTRKLGTRMSLVDGGVFANNASAFAYNFVRKTNSYKGDTGLFLLSLGTGTRMEPNEATRRKSCSVPTSSLGWCSRFPDVMLTSESQEIDDELRTALGKRYVRIQGEVRNHSLDDCSTGRMQALEEDAAQILEKNKDKLDAFCTLIREIVA